mgnify:CR=1 FL=1
MPSAHRKKLVLHAQRDTVLQAADRRAVRGEHRVYPLARPGAAEPGAATHRSFDLHGADQLLHVPVFQGAGLALSAALSLSGSETAAGQLADHPRRGVESVGAGGDPQIGQVRRRRFQFLLQDRLDAVLPEMVRSADSLGRGAVSANHRVVAADSQHQGGDVHRAAAGRAGGPPGAGRGGPVAAPPARTRTSHAPTAMSATKRSTSRPSSPA